MQAVHHRAKARREELKLTQRQVADACGVTQQAYEKFERGETKRPRYLFELAKALKISAEWLKTGRDDEAASRAALPATHKDNSDSRKKIPVYSYLTDGKDGGHSSFDEADVIDRIPAPPWLESTTGAIALLIQRDDVASFLPSGTILYLDRYRYPSLNKPCLYFCKEGMKIMAYAGTKKGFHNFKYLDSGKLRRLNAADVRAIYKIVGILYT